MGTPSLPRIAVVPAAGLGTRLRPLTDNTPKELLAVGGRGVLWASLLEAQRAGVSTLVVVVTSRKPELRLWLDVHPHGGLDVRLVSQPEPLGVIDALERTRSLRGGQPHAVLFPDYVCLPDQSGLAALWDLWEQVAPEATVVGLHRVTPESAARMGRTALAEAGPSAVPGLLRIRRLVASDGLVPGALHTVFGSVRGTAHDRIQHSLFARHGPDDRLNLDAFNALAEAQLLYGRVLPGPVLDVGVRAGLDHAVKAFERGAARWRAEPDSITP